jgi:hypothetical protein
MSNFITDCLNGDALMSDVDDYIDKWHNTDTTQKIYDFLGMTSNEYKLFVNDENNLGLIISAHKFGKSLNTNVPDMLAITTRSDDANKAKSA